MARDLDEMEDDNITEEDLNGNSDECLWCSDMVEKGVKFCCDKCERKYKEKLNEEIEDGN